MVNQSPVKIQSAPKKIAPEVKKVQRTQTELLRDYELRRIDFEKFQVNETGERGEDHVQYEAIQRAIKRMSYDYQKHEEKLHKHHQAKEQIKTNSAFKTRCIVADFAQIHTIKEY